MRAIGPWIQRLLKRFKYPLLFALGCILFGGLPMLSVLLASAIASYGNCTLNEGGANPCQIGSLEVGDTLANLFVAGWLIFVTLPIAMLGLMLAGIWAIFVAVRWLEERRSRGD